MPPHFADVTERLAMLLNIPQLTVAGVVFKLRQLCPGAGTRLGRPGWSRKYTVGHSVLSSAE